MENNSIYILLSKLTALTRHLDVIANNVANSATIGKKQQNMIYQQFSIKDEDKNDIDFVNDIATYRNPSNGELKFTNNPLDVAIENSGFFLIRTPTGIEYTRAGNFKLNNEGILSSFDNYPVLDQTGQNIVFQQNDVGITVNNKGIIQSLNRQIGQLGIANFDRDNLLTEIGNNRYISSADPQAQEEGDFKIVQFALEESNVDRVGELTNMMVLQQNNNLIKNVLEILENIEGDSIEKLTRTVKGG